MTHLRANKSMTEKIFEKEPIIWIWSDAVLKNIETCEYLSLSKPIDQLIILFQ